MWQDWVLAFLGWILLAALFPSIFSDDKPALKTSVMTGSALLTMGFIQATLSLWWSALVLLLTAGTWSVLAYQVWRRS